MIGTGINHIILKSIQHMDLGYHYHLVKSCHAFPLILNKLIFLLGIQIDPAAFITPAVFNQGHCLSLNERRFNNIKCFGAALIRKHY